MAEEKAFLEDFRFLSNLHQDSISENELEKDMVATLDDVHSQIKICKTLDTSITHHVLQHTCTNETGGELVMMTHRLLSTAVLTRSHLYSLTQRYLLLDSIYVMLSNSGQLSKKRRSQWVEGKRSTHETNTRDLIQTSGKYLTILGRQIKDLEHEMEHANELINKEKTVLKGLTFNNLNNNGEVTDVLKRMEEHLAKIAMNGEAGDAAPQQAKRKHDQDQPESSTKVQIISDDEYLDNLIRETTTREDREDQNKIKDRDSLQLRRENLERDLYDLQKGLHLLPQRKIGYTSWGTNSKPCAFCKERGSHFSDSCPRVIEGNRRLRLILDEKRCPYCLERCNGKDCREADTPCWYCMKVRNTILSFIIPNDDGHHRALCSVPDSKERVRRAMQEIREELEQLERMFRQ